MRFSFYVGQGRGKDKNGVMVWVSCSVSPAALGFNPQVEPYYPTYSPHLLAIQLAVFKTSALSESSSECLATLLSARPSICLLVIIHSRCADLLFLVSQYLSDHSLICAVPYLLFHRWSLRHSDDLLHLPAPLPSPLVLELSGTLDCLDHSQIDTHPEPAGGFLPTLPPTCSQSL